MVFLDYQTVSFSANAQVKTIATINYKALVMVEFDSFPTINASSGQPEVYSPPFGGRVFRLNMAGPDGGDSTYSGSLILKNGESVVINVFNISNTFTGRLHIFRLPEAT